MKTLGYSGEIRKIYRLLFMQECLRTKRKSGDAGQQIPGMTNYFNNDKDKNVGKRE